VGEWLEKENGHVLYREGITFVGVKDAKITKGHDMRMAVAHFLGQHGHENLAEMLAKAGAGVKCDEMRSLQVYLKKCGWKIANGCYKKSIIDRSVIWLDLPFPSAK